LPPKVGFGVCRLELLEALPELYVVRDVPGGDVRLRELLQGRSSLPVRMTSLPKAA